jgi:hypothetical protein
MTPDTHRLIRHVFAPADQAGATELLDCDCGRNLPFCDRSTDQQLERHRFAAVKLSRGDLGRLVDAIAMAQTDWRDLLVIAGFADDVAAHRIWWERVLAGGVTDLD